MKLRNLILLLVIGAALATMWLLASWKNQPPEVQFVKATRETVTSAVPTNGKVEPIEWATARAERSGPVQKILIQRSQHVKKDQPLVELDSSEAQADRAAAQARIAQIRADLEVISRGGRATDLADITSGLERAKLDLSIAQTEYDKVKRLVSKQAAAAAELATAKARVEHAQLQINSLEQKRSALAAPASERGAVQARLHDAEAAAALADQRIRQSVVRAPIEGVVYQFDVKPGAYLNPGDVVASIGVLNRVRVNVYVDEPDLGSVSKGMPVVITWDALRARQWKGEVDKTATQIVPLGTRQVGEVVCVIRNPDNDLLPGTNVNVEIVSRTVDNAVAVPKEAIRRDRGQTGVFALAGDRLVWKKVTLGVSNTTRTQVEGLNDGDAVALASDKPMKDGMQVRPLFP
jgi:HlyD family secretion protein